MPTTVIPTTIDALVALANSVKVANMNVSDGYPISDDMGNYFMIGVDDPASVDSANSASGRQSWGPIGQRSRDDEGDIVCAVMVIEGSNDMKTARDGAFAQISAFENALRQNPNLGVPNMFWVGFGEQVDYYTNQTPNGAEVIVVFRVHYKARI